MKKIILVSVSLFLFLFSSLVFADASSSISGVW